MDPSRRYSHSHGRHLSSHPLNHTCYSVEEQTEQPSPLSSSISQQTQPCRQRVTGHFYWVRKQKIKYLAALDLVKKSKLSEANRTFHKCFLPARDITSTMIINTSVTFKGIWKMMSLTMGQLWTVSEGGSSCRIKTIV